jgi:hypothetical protein
VPGRRVGIRLPTAMTITRQLDFDGATGFSVGAAF